VRARTALVLAPLAALALPGCTRKIDEHDAEAKIADLVKRQSGAQMAVDCPGGVKAERGERFTCSARVDGGSPVDIAVELVDDGGRFKVTRVIPR
jgi:Domain of unknown function (DUF4333)